MTSTIRGKSLPVSDIGYRTTLREFCQIPSLNKVICLQEYLSESRFTNRVVLKVKLVESMERILVSMHIQCIDGKVIGR